jgi:hypothetical protein
MVVWGGRTGERTAGALPARDVGGSGGGRPILCSVEVDRRAEEPRHCTLPEENERDGSVTKRITCTAARSLFGLQPHNTDSRQEDGHHLHMIDSGRENHSERHNKIWKERTEEKRNTCGCDCKTEERHRTKPTSEKAKASHQRATKATANTREVHPDPETACSATPTSAEASTNRRWCTGPGLSWRRRGQRLLHRGRRAPAGGGDLGRA